MRFMDDGIDTTDEIYFLEFLPLSPLLLHVKILANLKHINCPDFRFAQRQFQNSYGTLRSKIPEICQCTRFVYLLCVRPISLIRQCDITL